MADIKTVKCPFCAEEILIDAKKCKHCNEWIKPQVITLAKNQTNNKNVLKKDLGLYGYGILFLLLGGSSAFYFFLFFDTSVEIPTQEFMGQVIGGGRINNLGLMQDRQNGIIISSVFAIIGAIMSITGKSAYDKQIIIKKESKEPMKIGTKIFLGILGLVILLVVINFLSKFLIAYSKIQNLH